LLQSCFQSASTTHGSSTTRLAAADLLSETELSAAIVRSRVSLTLPGELAIRTARATLTTTSGYPDALLDKHPASRASDDERIEVSSYRPPLLVPPLEDA